MSTKTPRQFFKPLAIGAPEPYRELPVKLERMIHFVPGHNEKVRSKTPAMAEKADVILANLEDAIPADAKIEARAGAIEMATMCDWKTLGTCASESAWQIELRNHKNSAVTVEDFEPIGGEWSILSFSHPTKKLDAHTFTFTVRVPANAKTKITYRVRVRWC